MKSPFRCATWVAIALAFAGCVSPPLAAGRRIVGLESSDAGELIDFASEPAPMMLFFSMPACKPCRAWYSRVADIRQRYASRDMLRILLVNVANDGDLSLEAARCGPGVEVVNQGEHWQDIFGTRHLPRLVILARNGIVMFDEVPYQGDDELFDRANALLDTLVATRRPADVR